MGMDRIDAANKRISFLKDHLSNLKSLYEESKSVIDAIFVNNQMEPIKKEISFLKRNKKIDASKSKITDVDIQRAREYPINQIIEFNNVGKALAWCHPDKNPSLSYWGKENVARCFTCNKTFDSISAAMELWDLTFVEAVRRLIQ